MATKKIAVIGSGISGLTSALLLQSRYDVSLFEQNDYYGGHSHTINVEERGKIYPINTGFIVFNDWTYPNFIKLMDYLGVESEDSSMSFSVRCSNTGLEYNGTNLNSLFCQRRNLLKPRFWRMISEILRFNRETTKRHLNNQLDPSQTLGEYLDQNHHRKEFRKYYIVPMGSAIWSSSETDMLNFPIQFFVRFFHNHGMLSVENRPQWRVISGGSRRYVEKLEQNLVGPRHLNRKISRVERKKDHVIVIDRFGRYERFDAIVLACHSDQALKLLDAPSRTESEILGSIPYQENSVVLHTDTSLLPKKKLGWAAWNYQLSKNPSGPIALTYNMNILQNFDSKKTFCVSLNQDININPNSIIAKYEYSHPCFSIEGMNAQNRFHEINGHNNTYYCGAYWSNGFHEDGVNSAIKVAHSLGVNFEEVLTQCKMQYLKAS